MLAPLLLGVWVPPIALPCTLVLAPLTIMSHPARCPCTPLEPCALDTHNLSCNSGIAYPPSEFVAASGGRFAGLTTPSSDPYPSLDVVSGGEGRAAGRPAAGDGPDTGTGGHVALLTSLTLTLTLTLARTLAQPQPKLQP